MSSLVQSLSCVQPFSTTWPAAHQAFLSFTISWSFLKLVSTESVMLSNHLILCHPLLLLPSIFPSIRVFSKELAFHIRWPKYWSFSFRISPSNEYSGLISFRIDWFNSCVGRQMLYHLSHQGTPSLDIKPRQRLLFLHCSPAWKHEVAIYGGEWR